MNVCRHQAPVLLERPACISHFEVLETIGGLGPGEGTSGANLQAVQHPGTLREIEICLVAVAAGPNLPAGTHLNHPDWVALMENA